MRNEEAARIEGGHRQCAPLLRLSHQPTLKDYMSLMTAATDSPEPSSVARDFLDALWPIPIKGGSLQIWEKITQKTHPFTNTESAAIKATTMAPSGDVYVAAGLGPTMTRAVKKRGTKETVVAIPGVWIDVDIIGGPEGKSGAARDLDHAIELVNTLAAPTLLVGSGYGLHAWWLFEDPWFFGTEDERTQARRLVEGYQRALMAEAAKLGITSVDSTFDLARLMRLPGTSNHKAFGPPQPVTLIDSDGPRYEVETLMGHAALYLSTVAEAAAGAAVGAMSFEVHDRLPSDLLWKVNELFKADTDFMEVWNRAKAPKRASWSQSEYDMSIANRLVLAFWDDQEIADCIAEHRRSGGENPEKANRVDYIERTIRKARLAHDVEVRKEARVEQRDTAVTQMETMLEDGDAPAAVTITLFNKLVAGRNGSVRELVQDGRDPQTARFTLMMENGDEVPLGGAAGLFDQRTFRNNYATVVGDVIPTLKAEQWHSVIQSLLNAATKNDHADDTRAARALRWVDAYTSGRMSTDRDGACANSDPFIEDGHIHVTSDSFARWVKGPGGEKRMETSELQQYLRDAGFERKTVNYRTMKGGRSSRSYYRAPEEVLRAHDDDAAPESPESPELGV